jgi:hypothetical protein
VGVVEQAGEKCYEFQVHNAQTAGDKTPYEIGNGEHYASFYYKAPWPDDSVATRYGSKLDNVKVLHHWLLFQTEEVQPEGAHVVSPLPTLNGVGATLLAGWAVGGVDLDMPADVGFELPPNGHQLNVQWHFYNNTPTQQTDLSSIQICVVPKAMRKHTASMTWIGTEDIGGTKWTGGTGMPPHQESTFGGTCIPKREGMAPTEPIHIFAFWPHMHQLGTQMETYVKHADGSKEKIFDKPFDFNHQVHYMQDYALAPGDALQNVCHFNNTTNFGVPFGESSDTEMCYQFTFAYPAHALENNVASLIGATNTCWCDGVTALFDPQCAP